MKSIKLKLWAVFLTIFISTAARSSDIPAWYTGNSTLYNIFLQSCQMLSQHCHLNCNVKSLQEFNAIQTSIDSCR